MDFFAAPGIDVRTIKDQRLWGKERHTGIDEAGAIPQAVVSLVRKSRRERYPLPDCVSCQLRVVTHGT